MIYKIINEKSLDDEPADSVQIRVFEKHSQDEIDLCSSQTDLCYQGKTGCCGSYFIFHDGLIDLMNNEVDLIAEGTIDSLFFREEFKVGRDGNRIFKISGPDTVYLQPMHVE